MIYAFFANGFEEIEAITFIDILRRADIEIKTVSIYEHKTVTGSHGIPVTTDITIGDVVPEAAEGIYLPGGMPGTTNLMKNTTLCDMITDFNKNGKTLIAICAAPMIFGELNLLNGKEATCYPSFEKYLHGAIYCENEVCVADNILTSRGAGTAHELGFKFVELKKGNEFACQLRKAMQYK